MKKEEFSLIRNLIFMLFSSFIGLGIIFIIFISLIFINKSESIITANQNQIESENSTANLEIIR